MIAQKGDERVRRHRDAIVLALAVADDDQALGEINIPDAQADAYHQTEVTAVEQAGYQLMGAGHHAEDAADLVSRQHSRKAFGLFRAQDVAVEADCVFEHVAIQEAQGAERLVVGRGGDLSVDGHMGEEGFDLSSAHLLRVAKLALCGSVREDEAFGPRRFFGVDGGVGTADDRAPDRVVWAIEGYRHVLGGRMVQAWRQGGASYLLKG